MSYQNAASACNSNAMDDIASRLIPLQLQREVDRMDHYLCFRSKPQQEAIRFCFFAVCSLQTAVAHMGKTIWYARKQRDDAVDALCEMYSFIAGEDADSAK